MQSDTDYRFLSGLDPGDYPSGRVAVAMSGGVDSTLAAVLLRDAGFEVAGITMRHGFGTGDDTAYRVAQSLGLPHHTIDARDAFSRTVVNGFVDAYLSGMTPNPCVVCNRHIKWRLLQEHAAALGYPLFATGHYARIARFPDGSHVLAAGVDREKDQSYFLWAIDPGRLSGTLFPLGAMTKTAVRRQAVALGLSVADRPESQEICFIPDNDYQNFLRTVVRGGAATMEAGTLCDADGFPLGMHAGAAFYTVGQRRGLGIATGRPMYVTAIDAAENRVFVGDREALDSAGMIVRDINWFGPVPQEREIRVMARIRSRHAGVAATVVMAGGRAEVRFDEPQTAVTPGQSAVFYDAELVMGGGVIEKALK